MIKFFSRLIEFLYQGYHHLIVDIPTKNFIFLLKKRYQKNYKKNKTNEIILVDFFDYFPFIFYWAEITNYLNKKYGFQIKYFYFRFYNSIYSKHALFLRKRKKIYNAFNCFELVNDIENNQENLNEYKILKNFYKEVKGNKNNIISYSIKGIRVGDLIYDTYLRTKNSRSLATIADLDDPYLKEMVLRSNVIFNKMNKIFRYYKVKLVLPSHSCYIQYGIVVRLAHKYKVPILYLYKKGLSGKEIYLLKKNFNDVYDNLPYQNFKSIFRKLSRKRKIQAIKLADVMIKKRFRGKRDNYMRKFKHHPYNNYSKNIKPSLFTKNKKKFFIFAHCFFDASHNFRYMIFPDFYEWITKTISIIREHENSQIYLKEHPFAQYGNNQILKKIISQYPDVILLDKNFSNNLIIKSKPYLVLTNHGSIGHEFAAKKIPVLFAGDNQHINYKFNLHAKNYKQYKNIILNLENYRGQLDFNYNKICEFLYMRYFHFFYKKDKNEVNDYDKRVFKDTNKLSNSSINLKTFNLNFEKNFGYINKYFENFLKEEKRFIK